MQTPVGRLRLGAGRDGSWELTALGGPCHRAQPGTPLARRLLPRPRQRPARRIPADLVVEGADVQRRVPRGVLGAHVGPVEEQMFQVLHVPVPAGLEPPESCSEQEPPGWAPHRRAPHPPGTTPALATPTVCHAHHLRSQATPPGTPTSTGHTHGQATPPIIPPRAQLPAGEQGAVCTFPAEGWGEGPSGQVWGAALSCSTGALSMSPRVQETSPALRACGRGSPWRDPLLVQGLPG